CRVDGTTGRRRAARLTRGLVAVLAGTMSAVWGLWFALFVGYYTTSAPDVVLSVDLGDVGRVAAAIVIVAVAVVVVVAVFAAVAWLVVGKELPDRPADTKPKQARDDGTDPVSVRRKLVDGAVGVVLYVALVVAGTFAIGDTTVNCLRWRIVL